MNPQMGLLLDRERVAVGPHVERGHTDAELVRGRLHHARLTENPLVGVHENGESKSRRSASVLGHLFGRLLDENLSEKLTLEFLNVIAVVLLAIGLRRGLHTTHLLNISLSLFSTYQVITKMERTFLLSFVPKNEAGMGFGLCTWAFRFGMRNPILRYDRKKKWFNGLRPADCHEGAERWTLSFHGRRPARGVGLQLPSERAS